MKLINFFRNILGHILSYGTCMNCSDSFMYKTRDSLDYATTHDVSGKKGKVGFMVCTECIDNHKGLNKEKIVSRMKKTNWREDDITMAIVAIDRHNLDCEILEP